MTTTEQTQALPTQRSRTGTLVMMGLLAALACVATLVIHVPSPTGGYMNLGDSVVLLSAYLLGPWCGAVAAGVGSAMADLLSGYPVYAPATLVIKAVMAVLAGLIYQRVGRRLSGVAVCGVVGEIPMVVGYWLFDALLLKSFVGSAAGIPSNLVQAAFGVAASTLLVLALRSSGVVRRRFPKL